MALPFSRADAVIVREAGLFAFPWFTDPGAAAYQAAKTIPPAFYL